MSHSEAVSYVLVDNKDFVVDPGPTSLLMQLAKKYQLSSLDHPDWSTLAKDYAARTSQTMSLDQLKKQWESAQSGGPDLKVLEASIARELGERQPFEIQQVEEGNQTSTTIVLLDTKAVGEREKSPDHDLVSLAISQSGLQVGSDHEEDFQELANEILQGDTDPRLARKRLKWDRKFRLAEANFEKRKKELAMQMEAHKRDFYAQEKDIVDLQNVLRQKVQALEETRKQVVLLQPRS